MKETEVERVIEKRLCGSLFQFVPLFDRRYVRRRRQIKTFSVVWARTEVAEIPLANMLR